MDIDAPAELREIVGESDDARRRLDRRQPDLLEYLLHAQAGLVLFELDGRPVGDVALPGIGDVRWLARRHATTRPS